MVNWVQFKEDTKLNTRINANVKNITQIDTLIERLTNMIYTTLEKNSTLYEPTDRKHDFPRTIHREISF